MSFAVKFGTNPTFKAGFNPQQPIKAEFGEYIEVPKVDYYDGEYSITPTEQEQTIPIQGKTGRQDMTVAPIPNNYGLITQIGSIIMVS